MIAKLFDKNFASELVENKSLLKTITIEATAVCMISFIYTMAYEIQPIRIQEGSYIIDGITPDRPTVRCACATMIVLVYCIFRCMV